MPRDPEYSKQAREIQRRMMTIRRSLDDDLHDVVAGARRLTDWRHYVRDYPLACLGIAAAVGFLIVPRRREFMSPDAETRAQLSRQNGLVVQQRPRQSRRPAIAESLVSMAGRMLLRTGVTYATRKLGQVFAEPAGGARQRASGS